MSEILLNPLEIKFREDVNIMIIRQEMWLAAARVLSILIIYKLIKFTNWDA